MGESGIVWVKEEMEVLFKGERRVLGEGQRR